MARSCIGIWTSFLVLFRVTTTYDLDETSKKSSYEEQQGTRLSSTLYERCLQMDTGACLGYILFNTAAGFIQNTTIMQLDNKTESGTGRQVDEDKVDSILLQKFLEFLETISVWSPSDTTDAARRKLDCGPTGCYYTHIFFFTFICMLSLHYGRVSPSVYTRTYEIQCNGFQLNLVLKLQTKLKVARRTEF